METMKSDLVKPPGTPVFVGTTPPVTVSKAVDIVILWSVLLEKSALCVLPCIIREATIERGEPVLFCEDHHKRYVHTSCVDISNTLDHTMCRG